VIIRKESKQDFAAITSVNDLAFKSPAEGHIIEHIRAACEDIISLVAVDQGKVVGHIFFSPVTVTDNDKTIKGMGLGPMAVLPEYQNLGIGSRLVNAGLEEVHRLNFSFVIVLGHPHYYPRFGFEQASAHGLSSQWDGIPDEAFMVMILDELVMANLTGVVYYRSEFNDAM